MQASDALFNTLLQKYRACRVYQDEGRLVHCSELVEEADAAAISFKTTFVRGKFFRFEWMNPRPNFIHFDWMRARVKEHYRNERIVRDVSMAVHHASRGTLGAADYVPFLLMPEEVPDRNLLCSQTYDICQNDSDPACDVLSYEDDGFRKELWIRRSDFALTKVVSSGMTSKQLAAIRMDCQTEPSFAKFKDLPDTDLCHIFDRAILFTQVTFDDEVAASAFLRAE